MSIIKSLLLQMKLDRSKELRIAAEEEIVKRFTSMEQEIEHLRWFSGQINKYVFPGELDTKDAALTLFNNLTGELNAMRDEREELLAKIKELESK